MQSITWLLRGLPPNKQWAIWTFVNPQHPWVWASEKERRGYHSPPSTLSPLRDCREKLKHAIWELPGNDLKYVQKQNRFLWLHLVTEATIVVLYVRHWAALMGILLTVTQHQMSLIACFSSPSYNWGSIGKNLRPGYTAVTRLPHAVRETSKGRQLWASGKGCQSV